MSLTRIHINRHNIAYNKAHNTQKPVISVVNRNKTKRGKYVDILSNGKIVVSIIYSPNKPLNCGATVWIETKEKVIIKKDKKRANASSRNKNKN